MLKIIKLFKDVFRDTGKDKKRNDAFRIEKNLLVTKRQSASENEGTKLNYLSVKPSKDEVRVKKPATLIPISYEIPAIEPANISGSLQKFKISLMSFFAIKPGPVTNGAKSDERMLMRRRNF